MLPGQNSKIYQALLNLIEPAYPNVPLYPMKSGENREDGECTMLGTKRASFRSIRQINWIIYVRLSIVKNYRISSEFE